MAYLLQAVKWGLVIGAAALARSIVLHLFSPPCACRTCGRE